MPQNHLSVRRIAVWTAVGLSLFLTASCRHSRSGRPSYSTHAGGGYTCVSPGGAGMVYAQPLTVEGSELLPSVPPAPVETNWAPAETYYPREGEAVSPRRSPVQVIKDRLKPLRSKVGRLFNRDVSDENEIENGLAADEQGFSAEQNSLGTESPQTGLGGPGIGHSPPFAAEEEIRPPQVPVVEDLEQFGVPEEDPLWGLPEQDESAVQPEQRPLLPVIKPESQLDLFEADQRDAAPTLPLAPEATDQQSDPGPQIQEERFDAAMPQLLPAPSMQTPVDGAKQVKFVPVSPEQFTAFQIPQMAVCHEVRSFEDYDELDRGALQQGSEILIYNTLRNFVSEPSPQGFRTLTRSTVELLGHGDRVVHRSRLGEAPDASRSQRRDYFITHRYAVPRDVPPGMYTLRLRVEDMLGHQAAHATMSVRVVK